MPDETFKVQKKKRKKLADASANENFSNKEEVRMQCARCNGEEDTCGAMMLMKTRARKFKERENNSKNGESTDYSSIAPDENDQRDLTVTESISKRSPRVNMRRRLVLSLSSNNLLRMIGEQ